MARSEQPTWVYQAMCEHGGLLYVGVAYDIQRRLAQHRHTKTWWPEVDILLATHYKTRRQALDIEGRMIRDRHPLYNIAGKPRFTPTSTTPWLALDPRGLVLDGG